MQVIPSSSYNGNGEKKTLKLIKDLKCNSFEIAFWSIYIDRPEYLSEHQNKEFSDIDFLLLTENGICCIEVKGGRVYSKDGKWYYVNRHGKEDIKDESPAMQAGKNKKKLARRVKDEFKKDFYKDKYFYEKICFAHVVLLPDMEWNFENDYLEMRKEIIFDKPMFERGSEAFSKFLKKVFKDFSKDSIHTDVKKLTHKDIKKLKDFFRPDFELMLPLKYQIEDVDKHILRMTEEQKMLLSTVDENKRIIINGCAGSGKTILALKIAEDLTSNGISSCYLVRNEKWFNHIKEKFNQIGCDALCVDSGFHSIKKYEAIIVDEGQDLFTNQCIDNFFSLLRDPVEKSYIYWFMDSNYQSKLYSDVDMELMNLLDDKDFFKFNLQKNCRNPIQVLEETDRLTGTNISYQESPKGGDIIYKKISNDNKRDHAIALGEVLDEFSDDGVHLSDICIITLQDEENSCVNFLDSNHKSIVGKFSEYVYGENKIKFYDVKSFKGQESKFVVVIDCYENNQSKVIKNLLYTSITRTTFKPAVIINKNLLTELICS